MEKLKPGPKGGKEIRNFSLQQMASSSTSLPLPLPQMTGSMRKLKINPPAKRAADENFPKPSIPPSPPPPVPPTRYWGTGSPGKLVGYLFLRIISFVSLGMGVLYFHWRTLMIFQVVSLGMALGSGGTPPPQPIIGRYAADFLSMYVLIAELLLFFSTTVPLAIELGRPAKIRPDLNIMSESGKNTSTDKKAGKSEIDEGNDKTGKQKNSKDKELTDTGSSSKTFFPICPLVSFFICCSNEPLVVVQDSVQAALFQNYPRDRYNIFILDNSEKGDENLKTWVEGEGAEGGGRIKYVRQVSSNPAFPDRTKKLSSLFSRPVSKFFDAENINWALRLTGGDLVAILTADMIATRNFLAELVPHFTAEEVVVVQCPLAYYNLPPGDPLNFSQQDLYDLVLPYRDARGLVPILPSGAVVRRRALQDAGGVVGGVQGWAPPTALKLHSGGALTAYTAKRLQAGLASWTVEGHVTECQSRTLGALEVHFGGGAGELWNCESSLGIYGRLTCWANGSWYLVQPLIVLPILVIPLIALGLNVEVVLSYPPFVNKVFFVTLTLFSFSKILLSSSVWAGIPGAFSAAIRSSLAWYWLSPFYWYAILCFFNPFVNKRLPSSNNTKRQPRWIVTFGILLFVHLAYICTALFVVIDKFRKLSINDCEKLVPVLFYSSFILVSVQAMALPLLFLLFSSHYRQAENRDKFLVFDESHIPDTLPQNLYPKGEWWIWIFTILPTAQGLLLVVISLIALTGCRPPFCTASEFFYR